MHQYIAVMYFIIYTETIDNFNIIVFERCLYVGKRWNEMICITNQMSLLDTPFWFINYYETSPQIIIS